MDSIRDAFRRSTFAAATLPGLAFAIVPADLTLVRWPDTTTTFNQPIAIRNANDGSGRMFVIERCNGVRVVKNGTLLAIPFLSINASCEGEQGILGLAFDPDYASNGTFYVTYTAPSSDPRLGATADQVLARYTVSAANPDTANSAGEVILRVPDISEYHNGGDLQFDRDGYLDWSMGDGGAPRDQDGFAQCTGRKQADGDPDSCYSTSGSGPAYYLLGKIIRLDVHATTGSATNFCGVPAGHSAPYAIPPGNPFFDSAAHPADCAEVLNWGLRNPFRFSIDRDTGDMLIGDVGQNVYEEIDFQVAGSAGQNFQWNLCEGLHTYPGGVQGCAGPAGSIPPKLEYPHNASPYGCAVTGGYVYRGPMAPLRGQYIFSDYCTGGIYVVANPDANVSPWTYQTLAGTPPMSPYSFGEDDLGNLYVTDGDGPIYVFHSSTSNDVVFRDGFE